LEPAPEGIAKNKWKAIQKEWKKQEEDHKKYLQQVAAHGDNFLPNLRLALNILEAELKDLEKQ